MLQRSDNWLLTIEPPLLLVYWLLCRNPRTQLKAIPEEIERILHNDARVESVHWYTRKEFESRYRQGGRPTPHAR